MSIIYKTTNIKNGKIYVGKDKINNPNYIGSGVILEQAIQKYGRQYFQKEILEECNDSIVDSREIYWIARLNSTDNKIGYNITNGGAGGDTTTNHPNKDIIVKKRAKKIKEWHESLTPNQKIIHNQKIQNSKKGKSNGHEGFTQTAETIEKIRKSNIEFDRANNPEWVKAHATAMAKRKGKPLIKKYKPVIINNIEYPSIKHAMVALEIKHRATFYTMIQQQKIQVIYK
jgi:hypothetical protein